jgi:MSHA biogenesis protein MshQ
VQWTGQLVAPVSGTYTFATVSDDGVRLWVDNQWLIDNWTDHPTVTDTSRGVYLEAGQKYPVRLDFYESGGVAVMQLLWAIPGRGYEVIPQSALTP